jgi:D-alanyl-D-alanine carboxypeptidase/D-alanyl-D-alanine-endopeptidase (penicillin-binding protein 4)
MLRRFVGGAVRRRRKPIFIVIIAAVVVAASSVSVWAVQRSELDVAVTPLPDVVEPTTTTTASTAVTSTTTSAPPVCDQRPQLDARVEEPPADWVNRLTAALADPAWGDVQHSISVWVDGYGEVAAVDPDLALLPASNEKLLTALGARLLLDPDARFRTEVRHDGDHLVLVAGGDPSLRTRGAHSLPALADQVRAAGVQRVAAVHVDASRFDPATTARGWQDWQMPAYVGPMSAFMVDDNRGRADGAYLADPALGNAEAFVAALRAVGVAVDGPVRHGVAGTTAPVVAVVDSPTTAELTHDMLLRSDNEIAEALVRQIGAGSTDAGLARMATALEPWCLHLTGAAGDGSGLSRDNWRSAREWRRLLQVAIGQPWAGDLWSGLPVAGRTGTLGGRLAGPTTNGKVWAKTGSIIGGSALSGYAVTPDGRQVVFSVVVNGEPGAASRAVAAIDRLVATVVAG